MKVRSLPILLCFLILAFIIRFSYLVQSLFDFNKDSVNIKIHSFFIEEAEASSNGKTEHPSSHGDAGDKSNKHSFSNKKEDKKKLSEPEKAVPTMEEQQFLDLNCNPELKNYTPNEIKLLYNLAQRRKELDKKEEDLSVKSELLKASEMQVEAKLNELRKLKSEIEALLARYNEKENQKLISLVKIYENMKPKDAAKIFDELDMQVLLQVISNMKETKVAPILSNMDPARAREVSIEYASQKKVNDKITR